jgi:hypothetical protein
MLKDCWINVYHLFSGIIIAEVKERKEERKRDFCCREAGLVFWQFIMKDSRCCGCPGL